VTLPTSVLGDGTAAIQDATGAIILRLSDEAGALSIGDLVQVDGVRSTKSGMETIRVSIPPRILGSPASPDPGRHSTGGLGEAQEARLVLVRGAVTTTPRRTSAQNVYFDLDDGSGPLRVYVTPGSGIGAASLAAGAQVEIIGVLGQETSGQQPLRGYRLWPRRSADIRAIAPASDAPEGGASGTGAGGSQGAGIRSGSGLGAPGGSGAGASDGVEWPAGIPAPRLVPAELNQATGAAAPTSSPDPRPTASAASPPAAPVLVLLIATGVLGAVGAAAAARPGIGERLLGAVANLVGHRAGSSGADLAGADGDPMPASSVEAAVARLVPLRVVDEPSTAESATSVDSRSAVRRILPPT
jgi:hypothetical protein